MQEESAAVVTGQRIKSTASEVLASRQKYQAKSAAAEMLRKHRVDSIESKALEPSKAQQVCFPVPVLLAGPADTQLFNAQSENPLVAKTFELFRAETVSVSYAS